VHSFVDVQALAPLRVIADTANGIGGLVVPASTVDTVVSMIRRVVAGADHLITGSDYGHNDPAEQAQLVKQMQSREDVAPALIEKILCDNPRKFYKI
jgi:predicted TIM-barrel fold metal-dependent hydrolase